MKRIYYILSITFLLLGQSTFLKSQTVEYSYDGAGNCIARKVITLKSAHTTTDTINTPSLFEDLDINVKIYPNPTKGLLTIEVPFYKANEELTFSIYNMSGKTYLKTKRKESLVSLDLSRFSSGIYILRMHRGGKYST